MAIDVIRHFRDYMESAPDELTAYAALLHGPDGSPLVGVIPCYCGNIAEGERVLQPLRKFGSPILDGIQAMPFPVIEVHLSNLATREEWRHHSIISPAVKGTVQGLGWRSYTAALRTLVETVREPKKPS